MGLAGNIEGSLSSGRASLDHEPPVTCYTSWTWRQPSCSKNPSMFLLADAEQVWLLVRLHQAVPRHMTEVSTCGGAWHQRAPGRYGAGGVPPQNVWKYNKMSPVPLALSPTGLGPFSGVSIGRLPPHLSLTHSLASPLLPLPTLLLSPFSETWNLYLKPVSWTWFLSHPSLKSLLLFLFCVCSCSYIG